MALEAFSPICQLLKALAEHRRTCLHMQHYTRLHRKHLRSTAPRWKRRSASIFTPLVFNAANNVNIHLTWDFQKTQAVLHVIQPSRPLQSEMQQRFNASHAGYTSPTSFGCELTAPILGLSQQALFERFTVQNAGIITSSNASR